jgi:outer membrane protein OmpA-like peptidoglycan-associated protein
MFSFTIPEFVVICVGVAFVIILILFPSFRQQLKALAGGFLQVFVQDTAKTPDGARAIYAQKIDEMTEKYTDACNTLRDLTGKLKTIQDNYAVCQKQAKSYDERAKAAMSRGDEESATTYARLLQEELDKAENLSAQFQKMKPAAEEVKAIKEKLENQLAALKGDFKSTSAANATTKVTVSDETRANITQQVTGNLDYDSMLSKTANVTFVPDSSVFTDQASAASVLDDFVNIAKTLDGTMIVINGNINADTQTEFGVQLSANRAQTVANYLASQGIDQNRLIITGSGNAKYQADKAAGALKSDASVYQSTDISFMRIEN